MGNTTASHAMVVKTKVTKQEVTTMTDEQRVTVKDIIDLLDYNREGRRNIRIIDSESGGGDDGGEVEE